MAETIFALVDCNSFYCSCERVFNPLMAQKPVVVLSNNDGCVVARTDEVKALGIPMGAPYFQIKDVLKKNDVQIYSSNYTLYGDMSSRVMQILSGFVPDMEIYSIDEAFLSFEGFQKNQLTQYSHEIKNTVLQWTGIPTCVGIGETKVLAKMANHIAKKNKIKTSGVFNWLDLSTDERIHYFKNFPVQDIWGVGSKSAQKLNALGINTADQMMNARPSVIRKILTVVGERILLEMNGQSCLDLEKDIKDKKQIISSRSFGKTVTKIDDLKESISNHITTAAEKLRAQNQICKNVTVFIQTNPFKNTPQYFNSASMDLMSGTSVTPKLIRHAFVLLEAIYKQPFEYKKCGIILNNLVKKDFLQTDFFGAHDTLKEDQLMRVLDQINRFHGKGTIKFASSGIDQFWKMLSEMKSPCYTTRWGELRTTDF